MDDALSRLAAAKGILPQYTDTTGAERVTDADTARALLQAFGLDVDNPASIATELAQIQALDAARTGPLWMVCNLNETTDFSWINEKSWRLITDGGSQIEGRGAAEIPHLPLGIHELWIDGKKTVLLCAPKRLQTPLRSWGVMVPLWGLRGPRHGGLGDFRDLAETARAMGRGGAGFLGLNPVHAGFVTDPAAISPYQPSHRRRLNILHVPCDVAASTGSLINYAAENAARRRDLDAQFADFLGDKRFDQFCAEGGPPLRRFAEHQALSELYGPYWTNWPTALRAPGDAATQQAPAERVAFHLWAQWQAELGLAEAQAVGLDAGLRLGLYLDLAVGTHPAGAETWEDRESFVRGASLGAPPDALGPQGQTWNLAPLHPDALISNSFQILADTLRQQFKHCGILRIDHILGFDRAFWVPDNGAAGAYVKMPRAALLAVARIEAARAGGIIVGEDLGVVPDGLRDDLAGSGILGCRLAMFERSDAGFTTADAYDEAAIASFSTHDLPTWHGWRNGVDLTTWRDIGVLGAADLDAAQLQRDADIRAFDAVLPSDVPNDTVALHSFLAQTKTSLVAVQAETLEGRMEQPNLPGTVDEYPNWRRRLTQPGRDLATRDSFVQTAEVMRQFGRK